MKTELIIKNRNGASAVEFAIVLPLLAVLVFGIVEFSLAVYDKAWISHASREGGRAGIVFRYDPVKEVYNPLTEDEIKDIVKYWTDIFLITFGSSANVTTTVNRADNDGSGDISPGDDLIVTVRYEYGYLVLPNFVTSISGPINLVARTEMRME
jgi:Flp pilus assembly pilin Flp